ncbi:MAG TPA: nucleoside permease [Chitinophagaceae bacterium]|nr:nucleoside permease [Chitinophagaceae bacterium]
MKLAIRIQLSVMMFLEFFIWGAWFVTMNSYLSSIGASPSQIGLAYGTQALGAIIAPFIIGLIADRFFDAQKILGVLHLMGAVLMYYASSRPGFDAFYPIILIYMIIYMPTLALVNSVSFKQMNNPEKEFSFIRVWGTIGWIVAGLIVGWLAWKEKDLANTFILASVISALLGIFSFTLPATPPPKKGTSASVGEILGLDALKLLKDKNFAVFFFASFLICIPLAFYYQNAEPFIKESLSINNAAGQMSLGQMSETLFMFLMPWFFSRYGVKKMLVFGMLAWVIRYLLFGFGNGDTGVWMLYIGILLHGICYDFFFVTGQIYTDERAGEKIRSSAQGMITLATYGVGMLIGFWVAGQVGEYYKTETGFVWKNIWLIPAGIAAVVLLLFVAFFKNTKKTQV